MSKILGFTIAASTGLLGGTFAPSLFIGASLCPVVDANGTVVGFVSPSDLMRARFREQPLIGEETLRLNAHRVARRIFR